MTSSVDPLRARDGDEPDLVPPDDGPTAATLTLLEAWRARLASHQAWHSDWEEIGNLDRAIATIQALREEMHGLRRTMASRSTIDQAAGMIMAERRCDADTALEVLIGLARDTDVPLSDVAGALVTVALKD